MAKIINSRGIYVACDIDKKELLKELECLQSYALDQDGKIQLMPKKKVVEVIGHSPDKLDALTMRMFFELKPQGNYVMSAV